MLNTTIQIPDFRLGKVRLLYVFATIIIFIIVVATTWYMFLYRIVRTVQAAGVQMMTDMDTYTYEASLTNTFITNLITYFLVIALFGLLIWVYVHAQKPRGYGGY